jgi:hypothetical protein
VYAKNAHILLVLLILLCGQDLFSQRNKRSGSGTRILFGPVIGFYAVNQHHAVDPTQKPSIIIGFRREQRVDREYKSYLLFGIDYFMHGLNFRSYFFAPDTLKLYDKSFGYSYSLTIHELNLPIQYKYLFNREDNSLFSPYVIAGYHLRYLLTSNLRVTQNGNSVKNDSPEMKFRTSLFHEHINAFVSAGIGWQKNNLTASKGSFFVELNYRYGFSQYYFEADYAASSLYLNSTHLSLQLGLKF